MPTLSDNNLPINSYDIEAVVESGLTGMGITDSAAISLDVFGNTSDTTQQVVYSITPYSNGCAGTSFTVTITVFQVPTAVIEEDITVCLGDYVDVMFRGTPYGTVIYNVDGGGDQEVALDERGEGIVTTDTLGTPGTITYNLVGIRHTSYPFCFNPLIGNIQSALEVEGVEMSLSGGMHQTMLTGTNGSYAFGSLEPGHDYSLTPYKEEYPLNGVTTFDLVLIKKHILGLELLDSPYKLIAADVNRSNNITTYDLVALRKLILGIDRELSNNTSWRFVEAAYAFPNPSDPWEEVFPELINLNDFEGSASGVDFIGVKIGDVNGSAIPNNLLEVEERHPQERLYFEVKEQSLVKGEEYEIAFRVEDWVDLEGYQYSLGYDKGALEVLGIESGIAKQNNFGMFAKEGIITTSWERDFGQSIPSQGTKAFSIVVQAKRDALLSDLLWMSSAYTKAEAYGQRGKLYDVALRFEGQWGVKNELKLYQNRPNPFSEKTIIAFELPQNSVVTLSLQDIRGRLIKEIRGQYNKGYNEILLDAKDLPATQVIYYTLKTPQGVITKKMIVDR